MRDDEISTLATDPHSQYSASGSNALDVVGRGVARKYECRSEMIFGSLEVMCTKIILLDRTAIRNPVDRRVSSVQDMVDISAARFS